MVPEPSTPHPVPPMKRSTLLASALGAFALAPSAVDLSYRPAEGTAVRRTIRSEAMIELVELTSVVNGQEVPPEYMPDLELRFGWDNTTVVTDHIEKVADGRPTLLRRTFEEVSRVETQETSMPPYEEESLSREGGSRLEGRTVVFAWGEDEEYELSYAKDIDGPPLDELTEDLDLRLFLPGYEVAEGDRWSVDEELLELLWNPGGNLSIEWTGDELEEHGGEEQETTGGLEVTFAGWDPEAEGRLALLRVKGDYATTETAKTTLEHIPITDGTATETIDTDYQVEGTLAWDVEAGLARRLDLTIDIEMVMDTVRDEGQPGMDFESTLVAGGEWTFAIEVEIEEE